MRRLGLVLAIGAALLGGCGTTTHQRSRPASFDQLETQIGRDIGTEDAHPSENPAVTLLYPPASERPRAAPALALPGPPLAGRSAAPLVDVSQIRGYQVRRRLPGAIEGLIIGFAGGAALGAILSGSAQPDAPVGTAPPSAGETVAGAVLFGTLGGLTGALIGALVGRTDLYLF